MGSSRRNLEPQPRAVAAALAAAAIIVGCAAAGTASASTPACPPHYHCVYQPQWIMDEFHGEPGHSGLVVSDGYGAPMMWVNLWGLFSGGDGHGGEICVTYRVQANAACLTPTGDLTLQPTGPQGPTGPTVTLTPAVIVQLEGLLDAGLTPRDVRMLHRAGM